jgi:hypothetical protein
MILISEHQGRWLAVCEHCGRVGVRPSLELAIEDATQHALGQPAGLSFRVRVDGGIFDQTIRGADDLAYVRELP